MTSEEEQLPGKSNLGFSELVKSRSLLTMQPQGKHADDNAEEMTTITRKSADLEKMSRLELMRQIMLRDMLSARGIDTEGREGPTRMANEEPYLCDEYRMPERSLFSQDEPNAAGNLSKEADPRLIRGGAPLRVLNREGLLHQWTLRGIQHSRPEHHAHKTTSQLRREILSHDARGRNREEFLEVTRDRSGDECGTASPRESITGIGNTNKPRPVQGNDKTRLRKHSRAERPTGPPETRVHSIMGDSTELEQSPDPPTSHPAQSNSPPLLPNISGKIAKRIYGQEGTENEEIADATNESPTRDEEALVTGNAYLQVLKKADLLHQAALRGIPKRKSGQMKTIPRLCKDIVLHDKRKESWGSGIKTKRPPKVLRAKRKDVPGDRSSALPTDGVVGGASEGKRLRNQVSGDDSRISCEGMACNKAGQCPGSKVALGDMSYAALTFEAEMRQIATRKPNGGPRLRKAQILAEVIAYDGIQELRGIHRGPVRNPINTHHQADAWNGGNAASSDYKAGFPEEGIQPKSTPCGVEVIDDTDGWWEPTFEETRKGNAASDKHLSPSQ